MTELIEKIHALEDRIERAAKRAGRDADGITLVAVTKTHPVETVADAIDAGLSCFGENRIQEASEKIPRISASVHWHLIGHLQRNKVKKALSLFEMIHSLDSERLAEVISAYAVKAGKNISCLAEVNTSGEESKHGLRPEEAKDFCLKISEMPGINLQGLMTVGPFTGNPEDARPCFRKLYSLREDIVRSGLPAEQFRHLSMGMDVRFRNCRGRGSNDCKGRFGFIRKPALWINFKSTERMPNEFTV